MPYFGSSSSAQVLIHNWALCLNAIDSTATLPRIASGNMTSLFESEIPLMIGNFLFRKLSGGSIVCEEIYSSFSYFPI